jgi:seryl-tRNA synthetase
MHDLRAIRDNPAEFDAGLKKRGLPPRADEILILDRAWRATETLVQEAQARRKQIARDIGGLQFSRLGAQATDIIQQIGRATAPSTPSTQPSATAQVEARIAELQRQSAAAKETEAKAAVEAPKLRAEIDALLATLPNLPADDVPEGPDESANQLMRQQGTQPGFNFTPLAHEVLGERLGMMDFARAAKLSGSRFVVLKGALARLERALAQFMLDLHTREFGYTEVSPPYLVREETAYGTGNLPKAAEDMFQTTNGMWLIPTAEMPLTNLVAGEIIDEAALPMRFTAWTPSFRSEAGAAGRDTRGMIRVHQFHKVELVSIAKPEESASEHERMTGCAEEVLKRLGLAYRVMLLSSGDMGFAAQKTYDIEVWLPHQGRYREISSCSNCGAFQARRMNARYRPAGEKGTRPVHTLNGSGLAVGRTLIAILENYQRHDGTVTIPPVLRPYMGGQEVIEPNG